MDVINKQKERLSANSDQIAKLTARDAELSKSISVLQYVGFNLLILAFKLNRLFF
jgi:hypothetical protein